MVAFVIIIICFIGTLCALSTCLGSLIGFVRHGINKRDLKEFKMCATCFLIFFLITIILSYACYKAESTIYEETSQTDYKELVSLTDNSEVSGEFTHRLFYVYASIDTNEVYTFYYKLDDGGYKRDKVDSNITTIYEVDGVIP